MISVASGVLLAVWVLVPIGMIGLYVMLAIEGYTSKNRP